MKETIKLIATYPISEQVLTGKELCTECLME